MPSFAVPSNSVASNLAMVLEQHDLTTRALARMLLRSIDASNPSDVDLMPEYWVSEIVTPVHQGVDGQLVQAVVYSNEFRNKKNPQRVLVFGDVQTLERKGQVVSDGACLQASYGFKGTQAEGTWHKTCLQNGYTIPNMTDWALQAGALVESTNATVLTGLKQGCEIAKSEGLLKPHLPVICWSATGTLTSAWIDAYPGLAEAIERKNMKYQPDTGNNQLDPISANIDNNDNNNNNNLDENNNTTVLIQKESVDINQPLETDVRSTSLPENDQIYVLQTFTDPNSNCLLPPETPGTGLAHVCVYASGSRCDPVNGAPRFDYDMFSRCSDMATLPALLESNLPAVFDDQNCISRNDIGYDTSLRDCPFHNQRDNLPQKEPAITWGVDWTEGYSMATESWSWTISISLSLWVTAQLFLL